MKVAVETDQFLDFTGADQAEVLVAITVTLRPYDVSFSNLQFTRDRMRSRRDDKPKVARESPFPKSSPGTRCPRGGAPGPGDRVRMTFRVGAARSVAETLVARAIRDEKNIGTLVTEILEAAAKKGNG